MKPGVQQRSRGGEGCSHSASLAALGGGEQGGWGVDRKERDDPVSVCFPSHNMHRAVQELERYREGRHPTSSSRS